jgi:hypothetical protein
MLSSLPGNSADVPGLQRLCDRWLHRWPSVHHPTADAALTVINVRDLLLDALMQQWPRQQKVNGSSMLQVG